MDTHQSKQYLTQRKIHGTFLWVCRTWHILHSRFVARRVYSQYNQWMQNAGCEKMQTLWFLSYICCIMHLRVEMCFVAVFHNNISIKFSSDWTGDTCFLGVYLLEVMFLIEIERKTQIYVLFEIQYILFRAFHLPICNRMSWSYEHFCSFYSSSKANTQILYVNHWFDFEEINNQKHFNSNLPIAVGLTYLHKMPFECLHTLNVELCALLIYLKRCLCVTIFIY